MSWREYHEATKHTVESLRQAPDGLDWANMPDPFRHYEGVPVLDLPADPASPEMPEAEGPRFLSQLFFYSAAISAARIAPATGNKYALRVNPSSGNLHPTEFHFMTRGLESWPDGLYHYRPSSHMAEQRATGDFGSAPITIVLTSMVWREAWKYDERAWRYCLLDIGHAWQAIALAARAMGCEVSAQGHFVDTDIARTLDLPDDEVPLLKLELRGTPIPRAFTPVGRASSRAGAVPSYGELARRRRSALDFEGGDRSMTRAQLRALLAAAGQPFHADFATRRAVRLYLYVHRVDGLAPGVYQHHPEADELESIRSGDQRVFAAALSLRQQLAGNACVAFSMIGDLEGAAASYGDRGYRYVHFEAGAIGQRLYMAAEALGLGATGIGAFFDDDVHRHLGLEPEQGQVVYHFAIGYPVPDMQARV